MTSTKVHIELARHRVNEISKRLARMEELRGANNAIAMYEQIRDLIIYLQRLHIEIEPLRVRVSKQIDRDAERAGKAVVTFAIAAVSLFGFGLTGCKSANMVHWPTPTRAESLRRQRSAKNAWYTEGQ